MTQTPMHAYFCAKVISGKSLILMEWAAWLSYDLLMLKDMWLSNMGINLVCIRRIYVPMTQTPMHVEVPKHKYDGSMNKIPFGAVFRLAH